MIFNPQNRSRDASPLVAHITAEVGASCNAESLDDPLYVGELAKAVESYLVNSGITESVDSRYLVMLASKALSSIGEGRAARQLLVFGTGLVRPARWEIDGDEAMWILDLRHMTLAADERLELIFFTTLRAVLEAIAEVWDARSGRGTLGLRHVCGAAATLIGVPKGKEFARLVAEVKERCVTLLGQMGRERGWQAVPDVLDLDALGDDLL